MRENMHYNYKTGVEGKWNLAISRALVWMGGGNEEPLAYLVRPYHQCLLWAPAASFRVCSHSINQGEPVTKPWQWMTRSWDTVCRQDGCRPQTRCAYNYDLQSNRNLLLSLCKWTMYLLSAVTNLSNSYKVAGPLLMVSLEFSCYLRSSES